MFRKLFCKHNYKPVKDDYALIGYYRCTKCNKLKYIGDNLTGTHFKLGKFRVK